MKFPYLVATAKSPIPSLGGSVIRARPIVAVRLIGPSGSQLIDGLLDTVSDETVFEEWVAAVLGINLTGALHRDIGLMGRVQPVRVKYVSVDLRITDGLQEIYEWPAVIGFTPTKLRYPLLGHAGFLQFFTADFRGDAQEVVLTPNASFPGKAVPLSSAP